MKVWRSRWAAVLCLAALGGTAANAQTPGPDAKLALYAAQPATQNLSLSPDGSKLAYVILNGDVGQLAVIDLKTNKPVAGLGLGEQRVRELKWADNDNLVFVYNSNAQVKWVQHVQPVTANMLTISTGKQKPLLVNTTIPLIISSPQIRLEKDVALVMVESMGSIAQQARVALGSRQSATQSIPVITDSMPMEFAVNPNKTAPEPRGVADKTAAQFLITPAGQLDATVKNISYDNAVIDFNGGARVEAPKTAQHGPVILGYAADGSSLIVATEEDGDVIISQAPRDGKTAWTRMDLTQGDDLLFDRLTGKYWGAGHWDGDAKRYSFVSPDDTAAWAQIADALHGQILTIKSASDDHKHLIVEADSPTEGVADYLIDLASGQVNVVSQPYPGLTPTDISPVKAIGYKAADGLQLTGYLTLPAKAGANPRSLPLVVLPHDGPVDRDHPGFNWLAQALASQGYAVLQPNFRGSDGLGHDLVKAGLGEWGKKMESDLSDGVAAMASLGVIDPRKVCVMGVNYGGYAALAGVSVSQGGYRCAIAINAPSDLQRYMTNTQLDTPMPIGPYAPHAANEINIRNWTRFLGGVTSAIDPRLNQASPATVAANVSAPVLLIHADGDDAVPYEQSQTMAAALTKAGKPVQLVTMKGKDHALDRADSRKQVLTAAVAFLAKNNPAN